MPNRRPCQHAVPIGGHPFATTDSWVGECVGDDVPIKNSISSTSVSFWDRPKARVELCSMARTLVIGATGNIGREVVLHLAANDLPVRALTRKSDEACTPPQVEVVQ